MENHASNPAGRLWLYFSEMRGKALDQQILAFAAPYFGAVGIDDRYLTAVAGLMRLPGEVETLVQQLEAPPIPVPKLLRPVEQVRDVFRTDPLGTNQIQWLNGMIDTGVLSDLETTSHILATFITKGSDIDVDTLQSIRTLAEEIVQLAFADSSLTPEARAEIIRFAHHIVLAVDLYAVTGPQALVDELDRFYSTARRVGQTPSKPLKEKLGRLVGAIVVATELFSAPANLSNAIEYYGETFELGQLIEAPADGSSDIITAEPVDEGDGATEV